MSEEQDSILIGLVQELRRGTIILGVLSQVSKPQYGYSLVVRLQERGMNVEAGTLYPLLRRLEKQGLLSSEWDTNEARPRKYYIISETGKVIYRQLYSEWKDMMTSLEGLIDHREESE
ncbi:PadR family transcriptional regulator [Paenibacillus sp. JCM 10914]|uniref:PadR family transcriptional regulator n=1 Tax=Paenibacillus sp. JCM 10914 TaxID=1236974 RepID=UPI0003CC7394|nr:PadR family transcriptional regulator [Paenibacillus sp. JCM 10914]GAE05059.1 transcriptional regulator, PadR family [Paenibacillus sp. JCM 10914]